MDLPLRILIDHHLIRLGERKTGGRRSEMIEVNPALKGVRWRGSSNFVSWIGKKH